MRITRSIREDYEKLLQDVGELQFSQQILNTGIIASKHLDYPEIMILDQSDDFFSLFRNTGNDNYFIIGKLLRRSAHKLYRNNKKIIPEYPINKRFLNSVK